MLSEARAYKIQFHAGTFLLLCALCCMLSEQIVMHFAPNHIRLICISAQLSARNIASAQAGAASALDGSLGVRCRAKFILQFIRQQRRRGWREINLWCCCRAGCITPLWINNSCVSINRCILPSSAQTAAREWVSRSLALSLCYYFVTAASAAPFDMWSALLIPV